MAGMHSKGTHIYFAVDDTIYQLACPTGVNVPRATREPIQDTCIGDRNHTYQPGMGTPPTVSVNGNFQPGEATHVYLYNAQENDTNIRWFVGLGESEDAPDFDSAGDVVLPDSRSWLHFDGYISDTPIDIQLDSLITVEFIIQMSGNSSLIPAASVPGP